MRDMAKIRLDNHQQEKFLYKCDYLEKNRHKHLKQITQVIKIMIKYLESDWSRKV